MSKHYNYRILLFAMLAIVLMAGSAFAGTTTVNVGGGLNALTVSTEVLGGAVNARLQSLTSDAGDRNNFAVAYTTSQAITSGNFLQAILSGAAFNGGLVNICRQTPGGTLGGVSAGNLLVGTGTPAAGATSYNFQISMAAGNAIASGDFLSLTSSAACNSAVVGNLHGAGNLDIRIPATSAAGAATITLSIVSAGNLPVDAPSTATLVTIRNEFTGANNAAANHTIDYLGTPGNGTRLIDGVVAGSNAYAASTDVVRVTKVTNDFAAVNGVTGAFALTPTVFVTLTDSQNWQGVSKVFIGTSAAGNAQLTGAVNCADVAPSLTAAGNIAGNGAPNGSITLTIPAGAFNASGTAAAGGWSYPLCVVVNGTSTLNIRSISSSVGLTMPAGGVNLPASSGSTADTWNVNAYQALIPWAVNSSSLPTYCHISNASASTATVLYDVIASEGSVVLGNQTLGTIAPLTSKLMIITGNSVSLAGGTAVDLTSLGTDKRHVDRVTVTTAPGNVTMACIQTDPVTGGKRNVLNTP